MAIQRLRRLFSDEFRLKLTVKPFPSSPVPSLVAAIHLCVAYAVLGVSFAQTSFAAIVYVDASAGAGGNGSSWAQAKQTLSAGLSTATSGDEIWVADGAYPGAVTLKQGVEVYGGFQGTETQFTDRDPSTHTATISASGATQAVLINTPSVVFDGFTVGGGNQAAIKCTGGGAGILIAQCTILVSPMEGIRCDNTDPAIENCFIHSNGDDGIFCYYADPTILNCTIVGNKNHGINCDHGSPVVAASAVVGNKFTGIYGAGSSYPDILNSLIAGHASSGISLTTSSDATILNCLLASNTPSGTSYGGAVVLNGSALMTMRNSILADNTRKAVRETTGGANTVANCLFYGNPDGDYFDYEAWNTFTGGAAIDANVSGASGSLDDNPGFKTLANATWTSAPSYNSTTGKSTLTDANASYESGTLVGYIINCDESQRRHALIVDNSATTIDVVGFDVATYTQSGDTYRIKNYRVNEDSPCIDAGIDTDAPETDFDNLPRPEDVPLRGADGTGTEFDIGPFEFQPDSSDKHLAVEIVGGGTASPMEGTYAHGASVGLTATPRRGCTFNHWFIQQDVNPPTAPIEITTSSNPYNLGMTKNWNVWAYFDGTPEYIITANASGPGSVNPQGGTYQENTEVEITATAEVGARFVAWSGDTSGTENPLHLTMDSDKTVTANFTYVYGLTTSVSGNGTVSPASGVFDSGTQVTITATPDPGWVLRFWQGDASGSTNPTTVVMNGNKSVTAVFSLILPDLEVSSPTLQGEDAIRPGETFTLSWNVTNTGYTATQSGWLDKAYISRDASVDAQDKLAGSVSHFQTLNINQSVNPSITPTLPDIAPGKYFLLVVTDAESTINEVDESGQQVSSCAITVLDPKLSRLR